MKMIKSVVIALAVFMPFLFVAYVFAVNPNALNYAMTATPATLATGIISGIDWIWLIMFGAMILGVFYWLFYIEEEEEITQEFMDLDTNHDGYISREEASKWKYLAKVFDKFDANHDGKLSRQEFEKAVQK
jgi:hypothetical protein